jgi:integrase
MSRKPGSITYLEGKGLWQARYPLGRTPEGKRRSKAFYGRTEEVALEKMAAWARAQEEGVVVRANQTVAEYLHEWLHETVRPTTEEGTYQWYEASVRLYIVPLIGHLQLAQLDSEKVKKMLTAIWDGCDDNLYKLKRSWVTLRAAINEALDNKLLAQDPLREARKWVRKNKRLRRKVKMQTWTAEEATQFVERNLEDLRLPMWLLGLAGSMRIGEIIGLQWPSIHWDTGIVTVEHSQPEHRGRLGALKGTKTDGTGIAVRNVDMDETTMAALRRHRDATLAAGKSLVGHVFQTENGRPYLKSNLRRLFIAACERAGVKVIRPYDLRHTSATLLLLDGENIKVVQERLGHATSKQTLDTYIHVLPTMQARAAARFTKMFSPAQAA